LISVLPACGCWPEVTAVSTIVALYLSGSFDSMTVPAPVLVVVTVMLALFALLTLVVAFVVVVFAFVTVASLHAALARAVNMSAAKNRPLEVLRRHIASFSSLKGRDHRTFDFRGMELPRRIAQAGEMTNAGAGARRQGFS
jgi:uncharacterized membrane protein